ncbi:MAG TPA: SOS response-associated peptidase [Pirellulales bacterium]|nr:SOS response-associated peptidase [Pirellulales bacterium]
MCGRFTLRRRLNNILQEFAAEVRGEPFELFGRFNICPTNQVPLIRQTDTGRELSTVQWGFVPSWAKDAKLCPINAVSETIATKPMFRSAIKKRRCLVLADGFYEWKKIPKKIKGDAPWLFQVKGGEPFAFAGVWERWGKSLESCAILTTAANELMAPIHDRLPVILSPGDYDAWLDPAMNDPDKLTYFYEPFPASEMSKVRVSAYVNKAGNEGEKCIEP